MISSAPETRRMSAGDQLDRYELLCPIGEGGMAAVWLAGQRGKYGFQRRVALKTILPSYASEPSFRTQFIDESRLASRIHHENVAQVLDLGEEHDVLYQAIEWVDGDSLRSLERAVLKESSSLPHGILLRALSDTCAGLHAAHELSDEQGNNLGVVHRDISPGNILLGADGRSRIIDFGIAKARDRMSKETTPGIVKGKHHYMAPEQALGLPVDRRADIWAVGAVFYRLVTGKPAYEASSPLATLELLKRGSLDVALSPRWSVHPAVCKVMERALSPQVCRRFATAAEMRDALEEAMVDSGDCATPAMVRAYYEEHFGRRHAARKEVIRAAMEAAAARAKLTELVSSSPSTVTVRPGAYRLLGTGEATVGGSRSRKLVSLRAK